MAGRRSQTGAKANPAPSKLKQVLKRTETSLPENQSRTGATMVKRPTSVVFKSTIYAVSQFTLPF